MRTKHLLHKKINHLQQKFHFRVYLDGHLNGHLEYFKVLDDAKSKEIVCKSTIKNYIVQCRVLSEYQVYGPDLNDLFFKHETLPCSTHNVFVMLSFVEKIRYETDVITR